MHSLSPSGAAKPKAPLGKISPNESSNAIVSWETNFKARVIVLGVRVPQLELIPELQKNLQVIQLTVNARKHPAAHFRLGGASR